MSKVIGPKWRRLTQDEAFKNCAVCKRPFIYSREDDFPSKVCNNPCQDALEIVTHAKIDLSFDFDGRGPESGFMWNVRILRRMKEAA